MKKYQITLKNYKVKFTLLFSAKYDINDISAEMIHEKLLKYYRSYVISNKMQISLLYRKEYIINLIP